MTIRATGTFEVTLTPLQADGNSESSSFGRMSIDKQFEGDLRAGSKGEMLTCRTEVKGSAAYVAIEHVTGALHGRRGSFILQHSATMTRGVPQQSISVVPDSGMDELAGISGKMLITIIDGKHSYDLEYVIAEES